MSGMWETCDGREVWLEPTDVTVCVIDLAAILAQETMETELPSNQVTQNKKNDLEEGIMNTVYEKRIQW